MCSELCMDNSSCARSQASLRKASFSSRQFAPRTASCSGHKLWNLKTSHLSRSRGPPGDGYNATKQHLERQPWKFWTQCWGVAVVQGCKESRSRPRFASVESRTFRQSHLHWFTVRRWGFTRWPGRAGPQGWDQTLPPSLAHVVSLQCRLSQQFLHVASVRHY